MSTTSIHPAALPIEQLLQVCESRRLRRSGPGGQHRNKVETAVVLTHLPSGIRAEGSERRSQEQNRQVAIFRLRVNLALRLRCAWTSDSIPSDCWRSRVRGGRIAINPQHDDFPALLAEALDVLADCHWDVKPATEVLGVTSSQLVRLFKLDGRAVQQVNLNRQAHGLVPLR